MGDLESTDALSEITFGASIVVFLLLWLAFSFSAALFILIAVYTIGWWVSSNDSPNVFYSLVAIGLCTVLFMAILN